HRTSIFHLPSSIFFPMNSGPKAGASSAHSIRCRAFPAPSLLAKAFGSASGLPALSQPKSQIPKAPQVFGLVVWSFFGAWSLDVGAFLRPWSVVPWAIGQAMLTTALKPPLRRQPPNRLNRKERRERKGKPMKDLVARRDLPQEQAHVPFEPIW